MSTDQIAAEATCRIVNYPTDSPIYKDSSEMELHISANEIFRYVQSAIEKAASPATASEKRPCTCHPDDNPPQPCAEKYALSDCLAETARSYRRKDKPLEAWTDEHGNESVGKPK